MNNVFPWLNLARHQALQMIFHLIWQNKTRLYTSPIVFLSYFRNHIDIQRTFATLHSHWKLAHKRRCVDKMLNDLLAFGPDFLFLYFSIFFCLNFMPYVLCNGEECLLPCNVVRCVVVRTDKTEYMVMQVRGGGADMEFVQKFTPPDFKVRNFTPSLSPYFNSFSGKKTQKMSENGEIYSAGKNFTLPLALKAWTNSTSGFLGSKRGWHDRQPFLFGADWCNLEEDLDGRTVNLKLTQIDMA